MVTYTFMRGADRSVLVRANGGPQLNLWSVYRVTPGREVTFVAGENFRLDATPASASDSDSADARVQSVADVALRVALRDVAEDGFTRTVVLP